MATPETSSTLLHKILIPVLTTVLGATAIYFLGFNKKSSASAADIEKATVNAWQSFVSTYNINYKTSQSISAEYTEKMGNAKTFEELGNIIGDMRDELLKETKKLKSDMQIILKKDDNIDEAFVSMLNRGLDNISDEEKKTNEFVDNLITLSKSKIDDQQKRDKWQQEAQKFMAMEKKLTERSAIEAEDIATSLSKKYNRPFDLNELLLYVDYKKEKDKKDSVIVKKDDNIVKPDDGGRQAPVDPNGGAEIKDNTPKDSNPYTDGGHSNSNNQIEPTASLLAGQWEWSGGSLELSRDGDMYWTFNTKGYTYGDWKLMDGKIRMNATNPDTKKTALIIGYISDFNRQSFTLTFSQNEIYHFRKKADY